ncbi:ApeP family dehydratase [Methylomonas fluvii]|nr:3-hydroxylacyl-ACP dehydratase [Methylomonas fluvii]CAD6875898.1 3-hydroxydecanoyl-[ACP] dehydratase (EC 4.2.1.60) [Methylomonas fluvii]
MCPCSLDIPDSPAAFPYAIETLLPQSGRMVLLDRVLEVSDSHIVVELAVREDGLFSCGDHSVPAWLGLEYMAQAIAAYSGYHRKCRGEAIGLGFLLGTRYFECSVGSFPYGAKLTVGAEKIIEAANDMSVFDCTITGQNIKASSKLNVLLPQDSQKFLAGKGI